MDAFNVHNIYVLHRHSLKKNGLSIPNIGLTRYFLTITCCVVILIFSLLTLLTLFVIGYFGPILYTRNTTLSFRTLRLFRVLVISFKVSENLKLAKHLLFSYHGNCSMLFCEYLSKRNLKTTNFQILSETISFKLPERNLVG